MSDNNGKVTLARLEERMISLQDDVNEIKINMEKVKDCTTRIHGFTTETRTTLVNHLENHKSIYDLNWKWVAVIFSLVSLIAGAVTFAINVIIK